ncbi:RNA helicase [Malassezia sp. CBS 17886]|nr:RNA helicase [Malassezia sp. CBS 17886]
MSGGQSDARVGFEAYAHLLDARLLRALAKLGYGTPTPVQRGAIDEGLGGGARDIVARARTGSGKTLAYGLPVVQKILAAKHATPRSSPAYAATRALVLVPTRELAEQAQRQLRDVLTYCRDDVQVANLARAASASVQKLLLSEKPDIVVATPARALAALQSGDLDVRTSLESLVVDEADLILSYGYDAEVITILRDGFLSRAYQTFLMSATLGQDTQELRGLVLKNPAVLSLEHDTSLARHLRQYYVRTSEEDKFLLIYVILKLRLIRGKCLLFVNDIDRCFRLKLFLEQFGLRTCVLNEELPVNSRFHIVEEFNKGVYDYIIAMDGGGDSGTGAKGARSRSVAQGRGKAEGGAREFGVSRGIDFVAVACVVNFDLPTTVDGYIHRVGRTARAGNTGTALSFVVPYEDYGKKKGLTCATCQHDEAVWEKIVKNQEESGNVGADGIQPWRYDHKQVDAFRYRMQDALRSVTRAAIKEARIQEIKNEILNSRALKVRPASRPADTQAHFEENPKDLEYLRHDRALHPARVHQHMRHVPKYMRPRIASIPGGDAADAADAGPSGFVPKRKAGAQKGRGRSDSKRGRASRGGAAAGKGARPRKKADPLRTFS